MTEPKPPKALDAITDAVLAHKPKAKGKSRKKRKTKGKASARP